MDDSIYVEVQKCCRTCDKWSFEDCDMEYHYCEMTGILTMPSVCCLSWVCAGGAPDDAEE